MIPQADITELFQLWSKLSYSRLLFVDQTNNRFKIEFLLNTEDTASNLFLAEIQQLTIKKHPAGSVAWSGHWQNSQYKRYKIDFIDVSIKEEIDEEKLGLYVKTIKECLKRKVPAKR